MRGVPALPRLYLLASLFPRLTGHDLYFARQVEEAILAALEADGIPPTDEEAFRSAAAGLRARMGGSAGEEQGFFHWDASTMTGAHGLLFTRAGLSEGLKRLAPFPTVTILVTNLARATVPGGRRWTARRHRDYEETLDFIRRFTAARLPPRTRVNLIVV